MPCNKIDFWKEECHTARSGAPGSSYLGAFSYLPLMPDHSKNIMRDFRTLYEAGLVKTFSDIFKFIPYSALSDAIGAHNADFKKKLATPEKYTDLQVTRMAEALGLTFEEVKRLILPIEGE